MMISKISIILSLSICLSFNASAQYRLSVKGDKCVYDSAVTIELSTYRNVRTKVMFADSLISGYKAQIKVFENMQLANDEYIRQLLQVNSYQKEIAESHAKALQGVNESFEELRNEQKKDITLLKKSVIVLSLIGIINLFL